MKNTLEARCFNWNHSACSVATAILCVSFPEDELLLLLLFSPKDYVTTISKRKTKSSQATAVVAAELSDVIPRK